MNISNIFQVKDMKRSDAFIDRMMTVESVHNFSDLNDAHIRIGYDNDCRTIYAKPHPTDPDKALVSVQIAFTKGFPSNIRDLIAAEKDKIKLSEATTAIFYSITNWTLKEAKEANDASKRVNVNAGQFIYDVVEDMHQRYPHITTFSTFSPIQSFRKWVAQLDVQQLSAVNAFDVLDVRPANLRAFKEAALEATSTAELKRKGLFKDLERLAAFCVTGTKDDARKGFLSHDSTAAFHLGNGALVSRICEHDMDISDPVFSDSFGFMVHYNYIEKHLVPNKAAFRARRPKCARAVKRLMTRRSRKALAA